MLARRLPGILPPLNLAESIAVTKIHSLVAEEPPSTLLTRRPFRSPHPGVSTAGLIGGGSIPRPGEVSLAHGGVLFLDELPEFRRDALEALRQQLIVPGTRIQGCQRGWEAVGQLDDSGADGQVAVPEEEPGRGSNRTPYRGGGGLHRVVALRHQHRLRLSPSQAPPAPPPSQSFLSASSAAWVWRIATCCWRRWTSSWSWAISTFGSKASSA